MRLNIQGWDSLALDGMPLDRDVSTATHAIFEKHLRPLRVRGVTELGLFWISSGDKKARPSRVLDIRAYPAKRKVMCRLMLAPTARTRAARTAQYLRDMARLTCELLEELEARLAASGTRVDLRRPGNAIKRDLVRLGG